MLEVGVTRTCLNCNNTYLTFRPKLRTLCDECQWARYGSMGMLDKVADMNRGIQRKDHVLFWEVR